jgi:polyhydroxybutyrate depolymerase
LKILIRLLGVISLLIFLIILILVSAYLISNKTNGKISVNGRERKYLLYVPKSLHSTESVPLVITIHGYAEWPAHQAQISHWNELADQYGFIVAYPAGTGLPFRWRTSGDVNDQGSMEDVLFLSKLVDQLENDYNIDPKRIYVNGFSNGGGMTYLAACKFQERIAAVGMISGAYLTEKESCLTIRPVPTILFHGKLDQIVPYIGGRSKSFDYPFPNIEQWVGELASTNGCQVEKTEKSNIGEVVAEKYINCKSGAEVIFYSILNGGHAWPGGEPLPEWIAGYTTDEIDATELMWDFFQKHPLP